MNAINKSCRSLIPAFLLVVLQLNAQHMEVQRTGINNYGKLNQNAPKETLQFGQLIGTWQCISMDIMPDSSWYKSKAKWIFKYALDGYAIEDIWMEKKEDKTNNTIKLRRDFHGKNIRIYNPQLKKWQCIWLDNRNNSMSPVWEALFKDDEIVMHDGSGSWKIVFYNIKDASFDWKYEVLSEGKWITTSKIIALKSS